MPHPLNLLQALTRYPPVYQLVAKDGHVFESAFHLGEKVAMMHVAAHDVDEIIAVYRRDARKPHPTVANAFTVNALLWNRVKLAIEAIPNSVYSVCEITANMLRSLEPRFPTSFHRLAKKLTPGAEELYAKLRDAVGDLSWYFTAREMRTEWTHFSPSFVGGTNDDVIVLNDRRRAHDKVVFAERRQLTLDDLKKTVIGADAAIAKIAAFVVTELIVPRVDREAIIKNAPRTDAEGRMLMTPEGRMILRDVTMSEILKEHGLS